MGMRGRTSLTACAKVRPSPPGISISLTTSSTVAPSSCTRCRPFDTILGFQSLEMAAGQNQLEIGPQGRVIIDHQASMIRHSVGCLPEISCVNDHERNNTIVRVFLGKYILEKLLAIE